MGSSTVNVESLQDVRGKISGIADKLRGSRLAQKRLFIAVLLLSDTLAAATAFRIAYLVRFRTELPFFQYVIPSQAFYEKLVMFFVPTWIFIYLLVGMYNKENLLGGAEEYSLVFRGTIYGLLIVIFVSFIDPALLIARGWLLLAWFFILGLTGFGRFIIRRIIYRLRRRGFFLAPAIIIGANSEGELLAEQLSNEVASGLRLIGFVDETKQSGETRGNGLEVLGSLEQLDSLLDHYQIEELIVSTSALPREKRLWLFERFGLVNGLNLRMSSGLYEIITTGLHVREFAFVPLVRVNKARLTGVERFIKISMDYIITLPLLIFLSPFVMLFGIAIKLDSKGPIIHRRRVMGVNRQQFNAYKFRTMSIDGDEILESYPEMKSELEHNHKLKTDPRITRVGKLLRKFSLDELPQLFNVLKGEMSLVGPRMISPEEMVKYNQWGINLLTVRPGITGLWQVSGRSDLSYAERVKLDMHYIRNWTIWLDMRLLWQTIPVVIWGKGAY
jgi:exopolysaccharide biosynthesis polyprenyl glycosylphosphotransferase